MAKSILICDVAQNGTFLDLLSPLVGRATILLEKDQWVSKNMPVAEAFQLDKQFILMAPDNYSGNVIHRKNTEKIIALNYHEPFLTIDTKTTLNEPSVKMPLSQGQTIDAPMDGMFYLSPSPESPDFIKLGDTIMPGQTIGLIEVMKCFYPLKFQGLKPVMVKKILTKNATAINFGCPIFEISDS